MKPIHAKPSLYAYYFELLKEVAIQYGYNLVIHGSMNRDLDLIAIPWKLGAQFTDSEIMVNEFAEILGGSVLPETEEQRLEFQKLHLGRKNYIININREIIMKYNGMGKTEIKHYQNPQYYIDISVTPIINY